MQTYNDIFKTTEAFNESMKEAINLESNLSQNLPHNHCETLYLYTDEETGHIVTWCSEHDPDKFFLNAEHGNFYHKIPWQIKGLVRGNLE